MEQAASMPQGTQSGTPIGTGHGGDRQGMADIAGSLREDILDFSVNVRPEGPPLRIVDAMTRALSEAGIYPSAHAEEALACAARRFGLPRESLIFGNGSNELIHLVSRALCSLGAPCAVIPQPAFSEYAIGCRVAGLKVVPLACTLHEPKPPALLTWDIPERELLAAPQNAAVFLANPGNPAGTYIDPERIRRLTKARKDLFWILDEAFLDYSGGLECSAMDVLRADPTRRIAILRSLTKFHGIAGIRAGFLAGNIELVAKMRDLGSAWNMNALAIAASVAALAPSIQQEEEDRQTRAKNEHDRADLAARLSTLPLRLCESRANYLLFRLGKPFPDLNERLLKLDNICLRDCSDYAGLGGGRWFRAGVRTPQDHARLADALAFLLDPKAPSFVRARKRPALMLQGTSSNAGKSILAAAFCRILRQDDINVAPFKAQNMSLNAGVTPDGLEMGRAQVLQAMACGLDADVRMNPVLLKPHSDKGSQVILLGQATGHIEAREFLTHKARLWEPICQAYASLSAEHEVMILEGAGSPAEINLMQSDIVNMAMAREAEAKVLLVGDIDRGGVYASFLGTWLALPAQDRRLLGGWLVNRFRGDASLLAPAHARMLQATGTPVLGVIPHIEDLALPEEDSLSWNGTLASQATMDDPLDVAVVLLRHTANATDFAALAREPDVNLRAVREVSDFGEPDLVIVPGSKSTAADLAHLRESGLAGRICAHAQKNGWVLGVCGGMQILGQCIADPEHVESASRVAPGLGLLPIETTLLATKTLRRTKATTPLGCVQGYEIHQGRTRLCAPCDAVFASSDTQTEAACTGLVLGRIWGTYLHGFLDEDGFRRRFLDHIRKSLGKKPQERILASWNVEAALDRLADIVRQNVDMRAIKALLGLH